MTLREIPEALRPYLAASEAVDLDHPRVAALARELASADPLATAANCYHFVRDKVSHSVDAQVVRPVTFRASEVLAAGTGLCYAKSHLLAALLRANGIPAGLCYQRLVLGAKGALGLHGLNAALLPGAGWLRLDPRGNKPGAEGRFEPPTEVLPRLPRLPGEADLPGIFAEPLACIRDSLTTASDLPGLLARLPDQEPGDGPQPPDLSWDYFRM